LKSPVPVSPKATKPRRKQSERSEEMRAKLVKAAFDVFAERGHSAFRTAAVAEKAGVSEGAQVHHFANKDGLTVAALEYAFSEAFDASAARRELIPTGENPLPHLIRDLRAYFLGMHYWVALDIAIDGAKNDAISAPLRQLAGEYRGKVYADWSDLLVQSGWPPDDADEMVRMAAATLAGMGMRSLWENIEPAIDQVVKRIEQMIVAVWPVPRAFVKAYEAKGWSVKASL